MKKAQRTLLAALLLPAACAGEVAGGPEAEVSSAVVAVRHRTLGSGHYFGLAIVGEGRLWAWGNNSSGQLGDGTRTSRPLPIELPVAGPFVSVAAGYAHSIALKNDGTVWAFGDNRHGQIGTGSSEARQLVPVEVPAIRGAVAVGAGTYSSFAILSDGAVLAWGRNNAGQLGDGTTTDRATPVSVAGLPPMVEVTGGLSHSVGLASDGTVWAWGDNGQGQLGTGGVATRVPALVSLPALAAGVSAGAYHTLALAEDGGVFAWGYNSYGQLGDGTMTTRRLPVALPGVAGARAVSAGYVHSLIATAAGEVKSAGYNGYGQLGDGTKTSRASLVTVPGLTGAIDVAAGRFHSLVLIGGSAEPVAGFGEGRHGQLGYAATNLAMQLAPVAVRFSAPRNLRPNVHLLIEDSSAMNGLAAAGAACSGATDWFFTRHLGVGARTRIDWVIAALGGCRSPSDGVLDRWVDPVLGKVNVAARRLTVWGEAEIAGWSADNAQAEAAIDWIELGGQLGYGGSADLTGGLHRGASMYAALPADTGSFAPNVQILISKGVNNPTTMLFNHACDGSNVLLTSSPAEGARYLAGSDMICAIPGVQPIPTYVIAIQPTTGQRVMLQEVAFAGGGLYLEAASFEQLSAAFDAAFADIAAKTAP